ncbi:MAG: FAD-linked oxidase [Ignavibacteria bacterium GWB2_35_12]|nr:MAG: FAD-linked oxidase [Ignavibacteria bacterium GWA2_35_8]OGU38379.1 MAG: FAD-linked oxidase [Ignavibacteria bacterium GWB2_35_12]OGU94172.1 MAG: FAD-linked oxidase [Ignavibacteria bacterium RIFOXYA2_FULL_35_10]OGV23384.1 MAG: FAD-linked oxidase [Ignavibacteria bacterium RIFOXYC2_FULL_35_21]
MIIGDYESWGRYPKYKPNDVFSVYWRNEIPDLGKFPNKILPYAWGKSYGDSCLNENGILIDTKNLSKFISFDEENGLFRCEAGVTLASILDFFVPRGWFLSVTPGTKFISVAGAVANDVHGKNHHNSGSFGCHVTKFELVRSSGERLICSNEENTELFKATIGGLGLTGLITWVEFKLKPCPSAFFAMESEKFYNVDEFFDINDKSEKTFDYTVSWVDCTASGSSLGRGIYNRGNHAHPEEYEIPKLPNQKLKSFPFDAAFINSFSVNVFNMLYFNKQINRIEKNVVHYDPFFYPLDAVLHWNKAYGKQGFLQYQFVVPFGNEKDTIREILKQVSGSGMSSFLTVLKTFGDMKSPGMLSFPRPGVTMAIDFRMNGDKTLKFLESLDSIVRESGGVIYPAKDARMSAEDFQKFYPQWTEFEKYIDPAFSSSFWRRVTKKINN